MKRRFGGIFLRGSTLGAAGRSGGISFDKRVRKLRFKNAEERRKWREIKFINSVGDK